MAMSESRQTTSPESVVEGVFLVPDGKTLVDPSNVLMQSLLDEDGFVVDVTIPMSSFEHSMMLTDELIDSMLADDILVHWGVKGMKWGVRRSEKELAKARSVADQLAEARGHEKGSVVKTSKGYASGEAMQAAQLKQIAKSYGSSALSNNDLKVLNERLNLEKNFANLSPKEKTKLQKTLDGVKTAGKINKALGNPAGKALKTLVDSKTAGSGSKTAKAAQAAAAAAAGAGKTSKKTKKNSSSNLPKAGKNLDITLSQLDAIAKISASSPKSSIGNKSSSSAANDMLNMDLVNSLVEKNR